jgi:ornithine cyclodeaminase/alanine dehydrogenase-like protein (mu-crystallin family)
VAIGLASGVITSAEGSADLPALCRGAERRRAPAEITLFKSVGAAIEDLAAAILVWRRSGGPEP